MYQSYLSHLFIYCKVISKIDQSAFVQNGIEVNVPLMTNELHSFVEEYSNLRDVEKKTLKDHGLPIHPQNVRVTVAKLMGSSVRGVKDRFGGGAKERAKENIKNGCAQQIDKDVLAKRACAWCAKALPYSSFNSGISSTYCSHECAEEGRLRRGVSSVRNQVFALERGICSFCGIDAYALFLRIKALQPAERLNALYNANWKLPKSMVAHERLLHSPRQGDFWQADHIVPVAEGGGDCSLDNLRTLCTPCHQKETSLLHYRLRFKPQENHPKQKNIMDMLSPSASKSKKRKSAD